MGSPFFEGLLAGQGAGTAERPDLDGTPRLFAYTRLGDPAQSTDVYAGVGIARALAVADADVTLWRNLTLLALVGSLALVAAWVGGELFFLRPVRALVGATRRVRAGDLSARARLGPVAGELGQLSQSFDEMMASLEQAERQRAVQEELRRQHSVLEAELAQAARVQAELLPRECPTLPGFDLAARCIPAREVGATSTTGRSRPRASCP
jgi:HAMP domain-containing protein